MLRGAVYYQTTGLHFNALTRGSSFMKNFCTLLKWSKWPLPALSSMWWKLISLHYTPVQLVTNEKVAQLNQKRKGCKIILYFKFRYPPPLKSWERKRERKKVRSLRGNGYRWKNFKCLFFIYIIHVVIMIISFRHPAPYKAERKREREELPNRWKTFWCLFFM